MTQTTQGSKKGQSMRIFVIFSLAVGILITVSLVFKFVAAVAKSSFDGQHRFTILQKGNPARLYSFAPDTKTISLVEIKKDGEVPLGNLLSIPLDATVEDTSDAAAQKSPDAYLQHLFFHPEIKTTMTELDVLRLWLFARSVESNEILSERISLSERSQIGGSDRILSELFADYTVGEENKSIQVVNATGVSGVGSDFSRKLSNMGAHVVSVTTARKKAKNTTVQYYGQSSYTLKKIEKMLGKKAQLLQKQGISDIIITLGEEQTKQQ